MHYGTVVEFFPKKGFGFIRPDFGLDVFFHITALGACQERPEIEPGQMVRFELMPAPDSKSTARAGTAKREPQESAHPQAMMVELVDAIVEETRGRVRPTSPSSARHPRARGKKPTWRR